LRKRKNRISFSVHQPNKISQIPVLGSAAQRFLSFTLGTFTILLLSPAKMSNVGFSKGVLEVAKFAVYVSVPVFLMSFAADTKFLHKLTGKQDYVVYPPEAERPPSPEELREMARQLARERKAQ
ncbi:hypothetical protein LINGRAHAP2_LOCUS15543, partial [Linum grandiflorum]